MPKLSIFAAYLGQPCTIGIGSDRYAATVSWVSWSGRRIRIVRCDSALNPDGSCSYETNFNNPEEEWSLRKDGRFLPKGATKRSGYYLILGKRDSYLDPSF